ncbi:MAG TPA: hypothetical protein VLS89_20330, partial [Candidatus Nanopelagicales bacterium]|nr:hypothetical protein [Candidatus Nanopelagicales bacterium]
LTRADKLALLELELVCQDGKRALGRGDSSIGERLPELLWDADFTDIQVCQSDKCAALIPPYDPPEQRLELAQMLAWIDGGIWIGSGGTREQTLELYLAGGGDAAAFDSKWVTAMKEAHAWKHAVLSRTLCASRGVTFYLVTGRTPA